MDRIEAYPLMHTHVQRELGTAGAEGGSRGYQAIVFV